MSSADTDQEFKLQEIDECLIPQVLDILKLQFPRAIHMYYFIWMQLEWAKKGLLSAIKVYCYNGDLDEGIFVAVSKISTPQTYRIMVHSSDRDQSKLKKALKTLPVYWSDNPLFEAVFEEDIPIVEELFADHGVKSTSEGIFNQVWLPPEKRDKIIVNPPEGTYLAELREEHTKIVNETWKYGSKNTVWMVKKTICDNFGIGLFRKQDDKLLAWNTMQHFAGLGMLFTDVDERKKGYGRIVTAALAKALVEKDIIPYACIRDNNKPSMAVYTKIGFVITDRLTWIFRVS